MDECHKHVIWFVSRSQVSWRTPVSQYLKGPSWRCHTLSLSMCFSSCSLVPPATGAVYDTQATCKFTQCVYTVLCSPSHLSLHFSFCHFLLPLSQVVVDQWLRSASACERVASVRDDWGVLRVSLSCYVLHDRSFSNPSRTCSGPAFWLVCVYVHLWVWSV